MGERKLAARVERADKTIDAATRLVSLEFPVRSFVERVVAAEAQLVRQTRADALSRNSGSVECLDALSDVLSRLSALGEELRQKTSYECSGAGTNDPECWRAAFQDLADACDSPAMVLHAVEEAFVS